MDIRSNGATLVLGSTKQRVFCAMLLLNANHVVSYECLADALWDGPRPASVAANLRTYAHGLRQALGPHAEDRSRLQTRHGGYVLEVEPGEVDLTEFERLAARGRRALTIGDAARAEADLTAAMNLWRGKVLSDLPPSPALAGHIAHIAEQRLGAEEDAAEARLALGAATELVGRLRLLLSEHPLRERSWALLMTALYRSGDVAGALAAYSQARGILVEETGMDPGPELRLLHDDILHHRSHLRGHVPAASVASVAMRTRPVPRQLPPDVAPFVGRGEELATVMGYLQNDRRVTAMAIHGPGGAGKSALAVQAAHRARDAYPGGTLYVDLRGADAELEPLRAIDALSRLLRALGVPGGALPTDTDEAAASYRSQLDGREVLIVLDNAADAAQVRPLLPADPTCAVIVTSRRRLATLGNAEHLLLGLLSPHEATALLAADCGDDRLAAEPEAARRLVNLCGLLPLALRVVGSRIAGRPEWPLASFVERLDDPLRRLDELQYEDLRVRSSLRVGYDAIVSSGQPLDQAATRAFRLIGGIRLPVITTRAVTALLGRPVDVAGGALDRLTDHRLLEPSRPGQYRIHDLLWLYARERAREEEPPQALAEALQRLVRSYIRDSHSAMGWIEAAHSTLPPAEDDPPGWYEPLKDRAAASSWLADEHQNLLAAFAQAAESGDGLTEWAPKLMWASAGLLRRAGYWHESQSMCDGTLALTDLLGQPLQFAAGLFYRSGGYRGRGLLGPAEADLLWCLEIVRELGDHQREAACMDALANLRNRMGDSVTALKWHETALALRRKLGDTLHIGASLSNMTQSQLVAGFPDVALAGAAEALSLAREVGSRGLEGAALSMLGHAQCWLDDHEAALSTLAGAIAATDDTNDQETRWEAYLARAAAHLRLGRLPEAARDAAAAEEAASRVGDRYAQAVARYARSQAATDPAIATRLRESARQQLQAVAPCREPVHERFFGPLPPS